MDTPEKARIGSPMANFEESPFSNFINSLSPIKPSKTIRISHTFGSLNFSSPPSVFTSPQINLQRESRFLKRDQLPELAKPESSSDNENKDVVNEDAGKTDNWPSNNANEVDNLDSSKDEGSVDEPCEASNLALELPRELKYDCGNSSFQTASSSGCAMNSESCTADSFGTQLSSSENEKNMDASRCDWANMMFDAPELLVFESPQGQRALKELQEKSGNEHVDIFTSLLAHFPEEDISHVEQQHDLEPLNSDTITQLAQANHSFNGTFTGQTNLILENKPILHSGIRRRCLVFEIPGAKRNVNDGSISTSTSSQDEANTLSNGKQSANMQGGDNPMCMRPGIGLHLNALAVASMGQLVLKPENSLHDLCNDENEAQLAEDASAYGVHEDSNPNVALKTVEKVRRHARGAIAKNPTIVNASLPVSTVLSHVHVKIALTSLYTKKLSWQHIESRNPLAFAPKVIRNNDSVNDFVDESNRTPASARHKRGCNCKKSNCLKKYCECYQGGVGCSIGCRCEGCKNTFGRKDGSTGTEIELDAEEDNTSGDNTLVQHEIQNDEELNPVPVLPKTPLRLFRSSMPIPSASKGKPSRFSSCSLLSDNGIGRSTFLRAQHKTDKHHLHSSASSEEFPSVLQNTSPNSNVKTLSPNSKRITPPNHDNLGQSPGMRSSRKLILQSIPSFPSLTPRR
ncbi:LOW QUALITY PROTEIN: hypothetical protein V2J09_014217 [Rumex salicifolius]